MGQTRDSKRSPSRSEVHPATVWLRLLRAPNLFTVPGDPVAGLVLSLQTNTLPVTDTCFVIATALCLYAAGILLNDLMDVREDLGVTPWRPFAHGLVERNHLQGAIFAGFAFGLLFAGLVGLECIAVAAGLSLSILSYNFGLKRIAFLGPLVMGLCRGFSVMLGVAAAAADGTWSYPGILASLAVTIYIACVTGYARYERELHRPAWIAYLPIIGCSLAILLLLPVWSGAAIWNSIAFLIPFFAVAAICGMILARVPHSDPEAGTHPAPESCNPGLVGTLIRALLWMQAGLIWLGSASWPVTTIGCFLVLAWWPSRRLSRMFYVS